MPFGRLEESLLVQRVVAEEAVAGTRQVVRARLRRERDAAAAGLTELGLEAVGLDLELGDGFERRRQKRRLGRVALPIRVDRNAVERRAERRRPGLRRATCVLPLPRASGTVLSRSNGLRIAPPTTSGSSSIRRFDTVVATFASSVDTTAFSATTFTDSVTEPRLKRDVDASGRARVQGDAFDLRRLETLQRRLDPIRAGRQVRRAVVARLGRHDVGRGVGAGVDDGDRHAGHCGLRRIHDDAGDRAAFGLRERCERKSENDSRNERRRKALEAHDSSTRLTV